LCLPPPTCPEDVVRPCDEYLFSSCRFVFDKSNTLVPFKDGTDVGQFGSSCSGESPDAEDTGTPANGGNGSGANSTTPDSSNTCEKKMGEIWGPTVNDPLVPQFDWPSPGSISTNFNRLPLGSQSTGGFRQLNTKVVPNISQRGNVYTMRFIQR
jgi:hypothetical protein